MAQNWRRSVGSSVSRLWRQGRRRPEKSAAMELSPSSRGSSLLSRNMEQLQKPRFFNSVRRVPVVVVEEERVRLVLSRQRKLWIVLGAAGGGRCTSILVTGKAVPYTHRKHFVLIGPELERQLGEQEFNNLKFQLVAKIFPPFHPPRSASAESPGT